MDPQNGSNLPAPAMISDIEVFRFQPQGHDGEMSCPLQIVNGDIASSPTRVRLPSKFGDEIGCLQLQRKTATSSLPASLLRRETGLPYFDQAAQNWWERDIGLKLLQSRAPTVSPSKSGQRQAKGPTAEVFWCPLSSNFKQTHNNRKTQDPYNSKRKWIRTQMEKSRSGSMQTCSFINQYIVMRNSSHRSFFTPKEFLDVQPFHLSFNLNNTNSSKLKWRHFDIWYVNSTIVTETKRSTNGGTAVQRVASTLFALKSESKTLVLYNLNSGSKIDELDLTFDGGPSYYSNIDVNCEDNRIYISSTEAAMKKGNCEMIMEYLVLDYPPLKFLYRVLVPKGGPFTGITGVEHLGQLLLLRKSSGIDVADFEEVLRNNRSTSPSGVPATDWRYPEMETIVIRQKPAILLRLKTTRGFLVILTGIWPPHVCLRTKDSFEIYNVENLGQPVHQFPNQNSDRDDLIISCDEDLPRIHVMGLSHGFDFLEIKNGSVAQTFSTAEYGEEETVSNANSGNPETEQTRRPAGLRQIARISYKENENKRFGFSLDADLKMLAVCMILNGILQVSFYHNENMKLFRKLQPVRLVFPGSDCRPACLEVVVHFNEWFLSVKLKLCDPKSHSGAVVTELYTANLYGEIVLESAQSTFTSA